MNPEFDEVLLTAYLDDEVTDAEREAVEEQLRTSESSRKLLAELRSVRSLVMQLHQAQPSRSFQSGPWNASAIHVEPAKAVLNESSFKWSWSYQKLASLAALIAIAMCIGVLILQPNGMFISWSENTKTDSAIERKLPMAPPPTDPIIAPQKAKSGDSLSFPNELEAIAKPGANPTEGGLAKSEAPAATSRDNARAVRGSAGAGPSASGGFGAPPARAQAKAPMLKQRSEDNERIPTSDPAVAPAPMVAAPPSFGMPPPGTAAGSNAMDAPNPVNPNPMNSMVQSLLKSLLDSPNDQVDWIELNTQGDKDGSQAIAAKDGKAEPQNLGRSLAMAPSTMNSIANYSFRYQRATEKETVADKQLQSQPMQNQATDLFLQLAVEGKEETSPIPFLIELQIPRQDWVIGAKRLRDLGIGVPMELPSLDYVDFTVTPVSTDGSVVSFDKAGADSKLPVARWLFQQAEPKERTAAWAAPKALSEMTDATAVLRLRVRAIKQQE